MLRKTLYPIIESPVNTLVDFLHARGITANQLTAAGAAASLISGILYANGLFISGGLVLLVAGFSDLLDGSLARRTGTSSNYGAFLDSTIDRYSDFFIHGGITVYFFRSGEISWFLVSLGIVLGAFMVSYARARAEAYVHKYEVGLFGRSERIVTLAVGTIITPLFTLSLIVLLVGTHFTALRRILSGKDFLDLPPPVESS